MKLIEKLKNVFFEEVTEDEDEEELPQTFAKKIEVPKKKPEIFKTEKPTLVEEQEKTAEIVIPKEEPKIEEAGPTFPMMFDDDDFMFEEKTQELEPITYRKEESKEGKELYHGKKEVSYVESVRKPTYSYTKSYYEEKETKGFKPSPIISPIYGILDKNYRKEEVVTKKETHVTTSKTSFDLDSVRNKAFGTDEIVQDKKTREKEEESNRIYDVNNNKPQVNRVTLADADEYYNDLGLAYNVDYSDASRSSGTRSSRYNTKDKKDKDVDDNLFDLIDSMYNKED